MQPAKRNIRVVYYIIQVMNRYLQLISRDTRVEIFSILVLLWITVVLRNPKWENIIFPILSVIIFVLLDLVFIFLTKKKLFYPFSSLVSGLLIGLIISPKEGIITIVLVVLAAFLSKHFIKLKNRHIFNPAAFGILSISLLKLHSIASWWSVAEGGPSLIIILLSLPILFRLKRVQMPFLFLFGYFLFQLFFQNIHTAITLTLDGSIFLFSFIMLPEPMTSTASGAWKYSFGFLVMIIFILLYPLHISFLDPLLLSLLFCNFITKIVTKN